MPPCPHFDLKIVQRSKRQSAVAAAAYQSGERLFSEYDQKQKYYSHKSEIVHTEIMSLTIQTVKRQEKTENPPLLYDLTSLQRDANRWLGYTAQQTLDYVQALYEKQLSTYPRTDTSYRPSTSSRRPHELRCRSPSPKRRSWLKNPPALLSWTRY